MGVEPSRGTEPERDLDAKRLVEVSFRPQGRHRGLPAEAFDLQELLARIPESNGVEVGRSFGFDEATNFTKFVRRVVGHSPDEFRRSVALVDPASTLAVEA